jgi:peptidoglycan/LPS O-acetylase OafA/YrhL
MSNGKNLSLEGLRGLAALGVVCAHFLFVFLPYLAHSLNPDTVISQRYGWEAIASWPLFTVLYNGGFQVSIFFVLSGYVLTSRIYSSGNTDSLIAGAVKRYPRLIIPAALSCLFAWVLLATNMMHTDLSAAVGGAGWVMGDYTQQLPLVSAVKQGFIDAPLFSMTTMNNPLWTIRIELIGSLLLFFCYGLFGVRNPGLVVFMFCIFSVVISGGEYIAIFYISILAGSLLHVVVRRLPQLSGGYLACMALIGLFLGGSDYSLIYRGYQDILALLHVSPGASKALSQSLGAFFLVLAVVSAPSRSAVRLLGSRFPVWLGRISFSMYLFHWPIICSLGFISMFVLVKHFEFTYGLGLLISGALCLSVIFIVSSFVEVWVDQPSVKISEFFSNLALGVESDKGRADFYINILKVMGSLLVFGLLFCILRYFGPAVNLYTDPIIDPALGRLSILNSSCDKYTNSFLNSSHEKQVVVEIYGNTTPRGWIKQGGELVEGDVVPYAFLAEALCREYHGRVRVIEHNIKGLTSSELLLGGADTARTWAAEMAQSKADIVVINTSASDIGMLDIFPAEKIITGYEELIRVAKNNGKIILLVSANPIDGPANTQLWTLTQIHKWSAQHMGGGLIDQWTDVQALTSNWRSLIYSEGRPSERLYRLNAAVELKIIRPVVESLF